jgi:hypothetical protein
VGFLLPCSTCPGSSFLLSEFTFQNYLCVTPWLLLSGWEARLRQIALKWQLFSYTLFLKYTYRYFRKPYIAQCTGRWLIANNIRWLWFPKVLLIITISTETVLTNGPFPLSWPAIKMLGISLLVKVKRRDNLVSLEQLISGLCPSKITFIGT